MIMGILMPPSYRLFFYAPQAIGSKPVKTWGGAVVTGEDDQGVVEYSHVGQFVHYPARLRIHIRDAGVVAVDERLF